MSGVDAGDRRWVIAEQARGLDEITQFLVLGKGGGGADGRITLEGIKAPGLFGLEGVNRIVPGWFMANRALFAGPWATELRLLWRLGLHRFAGDGPVHGVDGGFGSGTDHGSKGWRSSGMEMASPLLNESHSRYGRPDRLGLVCLRVCALKTLP